MALDGAGDRERRAAALGVGRPWMRDKLPVATPDVEWRAASGNAYGANGIASPGGAFVPYPNPRYSLHSGMQTMGGGIN